MSGFVLEESREAERMDEGHGLEYDDGEWDYEERPSQQYDSDDYESPDAEYDDE